MPPPTQGALVSETAPTATLIPPPKNKAARARWGLTSYTKAGHEGLPVGFLPGPCVQPSSSSSRSPRGRDSVLVPESYLRSLSEPLLWTWTACQEGVA